MTTDHQRERINLDAVLSIRGNGQTIDRRLKIATRSQENWCQGHGRSIDASPEARSMKE